jgi:general secretion pathway protein G
MGGAVWLRQRNNQKGVTLLELLITIAIIFILASIATPISRVAVKRGKEIELRQHLRIMREAIDQFKKDWDREGDRLIGLTCQKNQLTCKEVSSIYGYPKTLETLLEVKLTGAEATVRGITIKRYLRRIPVDPITQSNEWGLRCYADDPDVNNWCGDDVFDVYTKSPLTALDGTQYRDW